MQPLLFLNSKSQPNRPTKKIWVDDFAILQNLNLTFAHQAPGAPPDQFHNLLILLLVFAQDFARANGF